MATVANPIYDTVFKYRMEEVLGIFDQSRRTKGNRQLLTIDDEMYKDDAEMMHIVHRLLSAASDAELRQTMNVEDEYYAAIENRDTAIMVRDEKIAKQDKLIDEQSNQIAEQSNQIAEQSNQIAEQSNQIAEQNNQIAEQNNQIAEQSNQIAEQSNQIAEQSNQIAEQSNQIAEQSNQIAEQSNQIAEQRSKLLASAKVMKDAGISDDAIAAATGLPTADIATL